MLFLFTRKVIKKPPKNYGPVSVLPVYGNFFEKLMFNGMLKFFMENYLISSNQPGYYPGGLCINQFLSLAHETYKSLDCSYDVRGVFLTIRKFLTRFSTMVSCLNWNKMVYNTGIQGIGYKESENGSKVNHGC